MPEETPYTLQEPNSVIQRLIPAPPSSSLGEIAADPSPSPVLGQLNDVQNQIANYQSFGQKHPIMAGLANMVNQNAGYNPYVDTSSGMTGKDAYNLAGLQRQAVALKAVRDNNQEAATNQTHLGIYNAVAPRAGLPQAPANAVLGKEDLTLLQNLAQRYGAPTAIKAYQAHNQAVADYNTRKQLMLSDYSRRQLAGTLTPEEKKQGYPTLPDAPILDVSALNPYLTAGEVAGVTGTAGEAAKTGEEAGQHAESNATGLQEANARLGELKTQLAFQKQSHEDAMGQQDATRAQGENQFQQGRADKQAEHQDTMKNRQADLAYKSWQENSRHVDTLSKQIDDNEKAFQGLSKTYKGNADKMRKDPAYQVLERKNSLLHNQLYQAQASEKASLNNYHQFVSPEDSTPTEAEPKPAAPVASAAGHTIHTEQKTIKGAKRTLSALSRIGIQ